MLLYKSQTGSIPFNETASRAAGSHPGGRPELSACYLASVLLGLRSNHSGDSSSDPGVIYYVGSLRDNNIHLGSN